MTFGYHLVNKKEKEIKKRRFSELSKEHAKKLVDCKIAIPFGNTESKAQNVPFTIFEERESGNRQRFILWQRKRMKE